MKHTTVLIFGILGVLLFITASILGGLQIEGYSLISQFISESYATGLPNAVYLRYMYMASGLLFALFGLLAPKYLPKSKTTRMGFLAFAIFYGLGTIATGFFPCDFGCPSGDDVSLSQFIHNSVGFLTYAIVPFSLIGIGFSIKRNKAFAKLAKTSIVLGVVAFVFVILLFGNPTGPFIGLFQRIIESSILLWVVYTAIYTRSASIRNNKF